MKTKYMADCLLGGALGDSLGLPAEGLNSKRISRLWSGPLRQMLVFGHGMVSDDTEHAVMTLLSLAESNRDPDLFARSLARRLRWWLACVPAGVGMATARSIFKLWLGYNPARSGIWSAGNGPLMRAPIIGAYFGNDDETRQRFVTASTLMTHRDPRALEAAQMVAHAATLACSGNFDESEILDQLESHVQSDEMRERFPILRQHLATLESVQTFADRISRKPGYVTGFAPDSACVALFAWLRHRRDFHQTIDTVIHAGGDTDTIAFIAGSIAGIECGKEKFSQDWINKLCDWPINPRFLDEVANGRKSSYPIWPLGLARNGLFLCVVLFHGFRRLLPPY